MDKVAGIIVLYNPNEREVLENINSYIDEVNVLYCIDNSSRSNNFLINNKKCIYIPNYHNLGLAKALAKGCNLAIQNGASIIVTLDQDTIFENGCILNMINYIKQHDEVGAVSPNIKRVIRNNGKREILNTAWYSTDIEEVGYVITSGCVFRSKVYQSVKGFDTNLFIGQIDQDFCCSIRNIGKKVVRIGNIFMYQEMGNGVRHVLIRKIIYAHNLPIFRYYYIFRNERYLRKKWGSKCNICKVKLYKYVIVVLLFEKNKMAKIKGMIKGYIDGSKIKKKGL